MSIAAARPRRRLPSRNVILQLVGDGRVRLDDTVERWLPGALPYGDRITVEQLLQHTSGIVTGEDLGADPERALHGIRDHAFRAEALRMWQRRSTDPAIRVSPGFALRLAAAFPLRSAPGTTYHYSNIGYAIAGMIAAKASGVPLERLYSQRITGPLGLASAAYEGRFLGALVQGRLLRPAQLTAMLAPSIARGSSYGLGVEVVPTRCGVAYAHGGASFGTRTRVLASRDGRRVAVLLLNGHVLLRGSTFDPRADAAVDGAAEPLYCAA